MAAPEAVPPRPASPGRAEDAEEDDMPDYSTLEALLDARAGRSAAASDAAAAAFLPKRGEKDFEPTGFAGQAKALARSRATMYRAISGQRVAVARTLGHAVVDPVSRCATLTVTRRRVFEHTGITVRAWPPHMPHPPPPTQAQEQTGGGDGKDDAARGPPALTRLFPEETLYLLERGSLICHLPVPSLTAPNGTCAQELVPLSIEQASALLLAPSRRSGTGASTGARGPAGNLACTREQYSVYVYLKRLGYIVQRADVVDELRAAAAAARSRQAPTDLAVSSAPPAVPLLRRVISLLLSPFSLLARTARQAVRLAGRAVVCPAHQASRLIHQIARSALAAVAPRKRACGLLGAGLLGGRPSSYNEAFAALQFIPTYTPAPPGDEGPELTPDLRPFFYAWRPATSYKRTDPPPPEFRIAVVDGAQRDLLSLPEFAQMFATVPLPPTEGEEKDRADLVGAQNRNAYGRYAAWAAARAKAVAQGLPIPPEPGRRPTHPNGSAASKPTATKWYARFWPWSSQGPPPSSHPRTNMRPNPFPPLKSGRRNMVVAVVDEGTTSIFRFGESDFNGHKLAGVW